MEKPIVDAWIAIRPHRQGSVTQAMAPVTPALQAGERRGEGVRESEKNPRRPNGPVLARAAIVGLPTLALAGCSGSVLQPNGPIGAANAIILLDAVAIMLAIVVPTIVGLLAFAWWFRASNPRARYRPDFVYSGRIEIIVWAIPLLVILFLSGVIWIGAHELDPFEPIQAQAKPTEVRVVSLDWKWLFIYPDQGVAAVNELVVPADAPVHFSLTSATVMNMFFVPQLGSMIATMPGMTTQLYLAADHPGEFYGESAQFSGDGFSGMHFTLRAVAADAFAQWVNAAKQSGSQLDRAAYGALAQQSQDVAPFTYRAVDPSLFDAIVKQQVPPGPGPQSAGNGPAVRPVGGQ
jgi:cytochrome o ubiquinol oxidase subunit 2